MCDTRLILDPRRKDGCDIDVASATQTGHHFAQTTAYNSHVHQGDVYNIQHATVVRQEPDEIVQYGLCLNLAPLMDPSYFVGRAEEMSTIEQILHPGGALLEQRRVLLGGIGGTGKTQLALAYAQRYRTNYTSVFWLNAVSELALKASYRSLAQRVLSRPDVEAIDDEQALVRTLTWLADTRNTHWLLVFNNYDEPDQFDIGKYCLYASHGSVIITTRLPNLVTGVQMFVQPFKEMDQRLDVLQARSGRADVKEDPGARRLVERLGGLPLALVTAGAYLRKSGITFQQYLDAYELRWNISPGRPPRLQEYQDRTLYTTWDLSYARLVRDNPDAAQMLHLLAYFDPQDIWYRLLDAGPTDESLPWLQRSLSSLIDFENRMAVLVEYCFMQVQPTTHAYSMHYCVHDWTLGALNKTLDPRLYQYAFKCIGTSIDHDDRASYRHLSYTRLVPHAVRLVHSWFPADQLLNDADDVDWANSSVHIAEVLYAQVQLSAAEQMYQRALVKFEKSLGSHHYLTLVTINNLGNLYRNHNQLDRAEQMLHRALAGYEKTLGPDCASTLMTVNDLGRLYQDQDKLSVAEQMYQRALTGYEKIFETDHALTLDTINDLGVLYRAQGKLYKAEQMLQRALAGKEATLGTDCAGTLNTVASLGNLYHDQGKLDEAEQMLCRALAGYGKLLGPDHASTIFAVNDLGNLYMIQGKFDKADQMLHRALAGKEKIFGSNDHIEILKTLNSLGGLYKAQGKLYKAEQMLQRALARKETVVGPDHTSTLTTVYNLGNLYHVQCKLDEAERLLDRALAGYEKVFGPDSHALIFNTMGNLGHVYMDQGRVEDAERMFQRALAGYQKQLGPKHPKTSRAIEGLDKFYRWQGQVREGTLKDKSGYMQASMFNPS